MYIEAKDNNGYCDDCGSVIRSEGGYFNEPHNESCKYVLKARIEELENRLGLEYNAKFQDYDRIKEEE